jgi:hypothetical protein
MVKVVVDGAPRAATVNFCPVVLALRGVFMS